jgi:predicted DNA-binding transcriptional regulator AlpA
MAKRHPPVRLKATITTGAPAPTLARAALPDQTPLAPAIRRTRQVNFDDLPRSAFVREARLIPNVIPMSHASLWRKVKEGTFVQPVKLGARVTAFNVGSIRDWLQAQQAKGAV